MKTINEKQRVTLQDNKIGDKIGRKQPEGETINHTITIPDLLNSIPGLHKKKPASTIRADFLISKLMCPIEQSHITLCSESQVSLYDLKKMKSFIQPQLGNCMQHGNASLCLHS